jgi:phosphoglycolate phosphatase-like HAD superfamily hydrolase
VRTRALEALRGKPEDCLFVGDSAADMEAGRRAGVRTCAVRWGYGDQREMVQTIRRSGEHLLVKSAARGDAEPDVSLCSA